MDLSHISFDGAPAPSMRAWRPRTTAARADRERELASAAGDLAAYVLELSGLDPAVYRSRPLERRLGACLRSLRVGSEDEAKALIAARPELLNRILSTLLIGVTEFFRDPLVFASLREIVVPELGRRTSAPRVLSVGCANGAELYSVAILLAEAGLLEGAALFGTDCRPDAIRAAAAGEFSRGALEQVNPELRARYFERAGSGWQVSRALREAVHWRVQDGTAGVPAGPWDLVLCRNLLIYLEPATSAALLGRLSRELAPDGFLVVGKAERPPATLPLKALCRCLYRHVG